jgi:hypothetical protein
LIGIRPSATKSWASRDLTTRLRKLATNITWWWILR